MMDTTPRPSRSVPRGPPWEAGLRLDPAPSPGREKALPELLFPVWGWSRPSLLNFPAVTRAFLNHLQLFFCTLPYGE